MCGPSQQHQCHLLNQNQGWRHGALSVHLTCGSRLGLTVPSSPIETHWASPFFSETVVPFLPPHSQQKTIFREEHSSIQERPSTLPPSHLQSCADSHIFGLLFIAPVELPALSSAAIPSVLALISGLWSAPGHSFSSPSVFIMPLVIFIKHPLVVWLLSEPKKQINIWTFFLILSISSSLNFPFVLIICKELSTLYLSYLLFSAEPTHWACIPITSPKAAPEKDSKRSFISKPSGSQSLLFLICLQHLTQWSMVSHLHLPSARIPAFFTHTPFVRPSHWFFIS